MSNYNEKIILLEDDMDWREPYVDLDPRSNPNSKFLKTVFNPEEDTFVHFIISNLRKTIDVYKNSILTEWNLEYDEWVDENIDEIIEFEDNKQVFSRYVTGNIRSLLTLAFDVYCLQIEGAFHNAFKKRLIHIDQFQSVQYEIAVASILLRAGFKLTYDGDSIKNKNGNSCEFIGIHKITKDKISFEAKSKRFKGVLGFFGGNNLEDLKSNFLGGLFNKAKQQKLEDLPFIVFIDTNVPPSKDIGLGVISYFDELTTFFEGDHNKYVNNNEKTPYNYIITTNFSDHYAGKNVVTNKNSFTTIFSEQPEHQIINNDDLIRNDILRSLQNYKRGLNIITRVTT
ncbi:hypothetical protein MH215_23915 [Paenibacillus sp. ACRSA]|uniref:hypothetical protein n=1 Tax=Paenibacillus sp. ACRSA TaxID=2918211 RepID=UPI001EF3DA65|nr:hypothetical protein [Paenibacillus sp. ACRSA]MCG7380045.1 hypothetical protein [Paenibacillus sp. ACRSA]